MVTDLTSIAKTVAYFSCGFILIPAGRDIVASYASIMPGDDEMWALLKVHPAAAKWLWPMWGFNHCALTVLKLKATYENDQPMLKFLFWTALATTYFMVVAESDMVKEGSSLMGFIAICTLQCLSLGYLGFIPISGGEEKTKSK